jgi:hypothetical protein
LTKFIELGVELQDGGFQVYNAFSEREAFPRCFHPTLVIMRDLLFITGWPIPLSSTPPGVPGEVASPFEIGTAPRFKSAPAFGSGHLVQFEILMFCNAAIEE